MGREKMSRGQEAQKSKKEMSSVIGESGWVDG